MKEAFTGIEEWTQNDDKKVSPGQAIKKTSTVKSCILLLILPCIAFILAYWIAPQKTIVSPNTEESSESLANNAPLKQSDLPPKHSDIRIAPQKQSIEVNELQKALHSQGLELQKLQGENDRLKKMIPAHLLVKESVHEVSAGEIRTNLPEPYSSVMTGPAGEIMMDDYQTFLQEDFDYAWADEKTTQIKDFVITEGNQNIEVESLVCKTTICEVRVKDTKGSWNWRDLLHRMQQKDWFDLEVSRSATLHDDEHSYNYLFLKKKE